MSQHLLLLTEIAGIIGEARDLQDVLQRVVRLVAERMRTDVCTIWLLDGSRSKLTIAATEGLSREAVGHASLERGRGLTWQVLERPEPVILEDAPSDPHYVFLPGTGEEAYHSFLGLPLLVRAVPIGALCVQTREARRYTDDEVRALSALSSQIAPVVDNARLLALVAAEERTTVASPYVPGARQAQGTGCSAGVVTGLIHRLNPRTVPAPAETRSAEDEGARLRDACTEARAELLRMQAWLRARNADEAALVFTAQLMMLEDPSFAGRMRSTVERGSGAFGAIERVTSDMLARFARLDDLFFRERAADIRDLAARLKRLVSAEETDKPELLQGRIAVLPVLTPSRLVTLCAEGAAAVLTGGGGATSHAALLARSLDLPLVVGLGDFVNAARDGQRALVDAASGDVYLDPPEELIREVAQAAAAQAAALERLAGDGHGSGRLRFEANASLWGDAIRARQRGADGIGLYRTEFAFLMRPDLPGEEEQYVIYRRVVEEMAPAPVTFRLLDAGGDKLVPALGQTAEPNPFLGYRSLRLLLDHPEILGAQTRAILQALEDSPGRMLVPMVGSLAEFRAVRELIAREGESLPPVGAMIEVPSALMQLDELAAEADFVCVGTNDLTQHLLGVDRTNARVTRYFDACHPAVVRALIRVAEAAHRAGKPLRICGEAASNPLFLPFWLGLGVQCLSVHVDRLAVLRGLEAQLDPDESRAVVAQLGAMNSARDIRARLTKLAAPEVLDHLGV